MANEDAAQPALGEPDPVIAPEPVPAHLPSWLKVSTIIIAGVAVVAGLYFAGEVLLPVIVAALFAITFKPIVKAMQGLGIPAVLGASFVALGLAAATAVAILAFSVPFAQMVDRAPMLALQVREKLADIIRPVELVNRASDQVEQLAGGSEGEAAQVVVMQQPGLASRAADDLIGFFVTIGFVLFLMFFFLASGDALAERLVSIAPRLKEKKHVLSIIRSVESDMSRYLFTITIINSCLGVAIGTWLWWVGMPNPEMFGLGAALLNFLPYLGPLIGTVLVAGVALVTFDTLAYAALAPIGYMVLCTLEGQLITPIILGRRLELGPSAILIAIAFFGWLWGVVGMIVAVPLLMVVKIASERTESLAFIATLLGVPRRENGARTPADAVPHPPAA